LSEEEDKESKNRKCFAITLVMIMAWGMSGAFQNSDDAKALVTI
jgi:hypothetical protein